MLDNLAPSEMTYQIQIALMRLSDYDGANLKCCWEEPGSECDFNREDKVPPATTELPPECKMVPDPDRNMAVDTNTCAVREGIYRENTKLMDDGTMGVYRDFEPQSQSDEITYIAVDLKLDGDTVSVNPVRRREEITSFLLLILSHFL